MLAKSPLRSSCSEAVPDTAVSIWNKEQSNQQDGGDISENSQENIPYKVQWSCPN